MCVTSVEHGSPDPAGYLRGKFEGAEVKTNPKTRAAWAVVEGVIHRVVPVPK